MDVVRDLGDLSPARRSVVAVGNFDGVHLGHAAVLGCAVLRARSSGSVALALTFVPHPVRILAPGREPARLTPVERKLELIAEQGLDTCVLLPFDRRLAAMPAREFARAVLRAGVGASRVIVGQGFRFGADRTGGVPLLESLGPELGFEVEAVPAVLHDGEPVSSSRIRRALADGQVELARGLLGRPHQVSGVVVTGDRRGREIGFPTANLGGVRALLPGTGVYACHAQVGGERRMAAVHVGDRPTFGRGRSVEAHLLGFAGDLYGREIALAFVARLRSDRKFESVGALVEQIRKDVAECHRILASHER